MPGGEWKKTHSKHWYSIKRGTSVKCMKEWRIENNVFEYWGALEEVAGDALGR